MRAKPRDEISTIKNTEDFGFIRMDSCEELFGYLNGLLKEEREFFSGMKTKKQLGRIIAIANKEDTYEKKAEKFLSLLKVE